jgi:hypothetical protein
MTNFLEFSSSIRKVIPAQSVSIIQETNAVTRNCSAYPTLLEVELIRKQQTSLFHKYYKNMKAQRFQNSMLFA